MAKKATNEIVLQEQAVRVMPEENPAHLISIALKNGMPVETLERLMAMEERWNASQAKKAFLQAFAEFQKNRPAIKKNKKVGYNSKAGGSVSYSYAELSSIEKQIKECLGDYGFSYRWEFEDANANIKCTCFLSHVAGHTESNTMTAPADTSGQKNTIQSIGSTRTYLQRYTLIGVLGLSSADDDTDGRAATKPSIPAPVTKQNIPAPQTIRDYAKEAHECKSFTALSDWWDALTKQEKVMAEKIKELRKQEIANGNY